MLRTKFSAINYKYQVASHLQLGDSNFFFHLAPAFAWHSLHTSPGFHRFEILLRIIISSWKGCCFTSTSLSYISLFLEWWNRQLSSWATNCCFTTVIPPQLNKLLLLWFSPDPIVHHPSCPDPPVRLLLRWLTSSCSCSSCSSCSTSSIQSFTTPLSGIIYTSSTAPLVQILL